MNTAGFGETLDSGVRGFFAAALVVIIHCNSVPVNQVEAVRALRVRDFLRLVLPYVETRSGHLRQIFKQFSKRGSASATLGLL